MYKKLFCIFIIIVTELLMSQAALSQSYSKLNSIDIDNQHPVNVAQFVLNFDKPATYRWFFLKNPSRFVIDFNQALNQASFEQLSASSSLIRSVRYSNSTDHKLRIVFDLTQDATASIVPLAGNNKGSGRLFLTLKALSSTNMAANQAAGQPKLALKGLPPRKIVVVIDPGHGGKDPGASGPNGLHEKDVVLAISRDLYGDLSKEPGFKVYMTRYNDTFISLRQRLKIARDHNADIFVAIHADAYENSHSIGASVFALSQRGATSEAARWLAEKENYSELAGVDLDGKNNVLRSVLIDLSQTATITASLNLGADVLRQIGGISVLHHDKVEQARFVVLKSPDIPSILVETGFISNPKEAKALSSPDYQKKMAEAIKKGINGYFKQYPPQGSIVRK